MTAIKVILGILLAFALIGMIRVGGRAKYSAEGFLVWVKAGPLRFSVIPGKKKPGDEGEKKSGGKEAKDKREKKEKKPEEKAETGGKMSLVLDALPLIGEAAGALKRRIRIDDLDLALILGGPDPAKTAMNFGYSNAVIGMVLPIIEQNFEVRERRVRTAMDFTAKEPVIWADAAFSSSLGQLVGFALIFGIKFLKLYLANRAKTKRKKEAS